MKKILVTGAFGLVGSELTPTLQKKYGDDSVICLSHNKSDDSYKGIIEKGDVSDIENLEKIIQKHDVGQIYHLAGLLSVGSEKNTQLRFFGPVLSPPSARPHLEKILPSIRFLNQRQCTESIKSQESYCANIISSNTDWTFE